MLPIGRIEPGFTFTVPGATSIYDGTIAIARPRPLRDPDASRQWAHDKSHVMCGIVRPCSGARLLPARLGSATRCPFVMTDHRPRPESPQRASDSCSPS